MENKLFPRFIFLFLLFCFISPLFSQQIRVMGENDGFGGFSDRYYTDGERLEFHTKVAKGNFTESILGKWNSFFLKDSSQSEDLVGFSLGQEFYTPTNIKKSDVPFGDRPYASRIFAGHSLTTFTEDTSVFTEIELGMLGPESGGKLRQEKFHSQIGSPSPQGWNTQIPNTTTFQFRTDYRHFYFPYLGVNAEGQIGNAYTKMNLGLIFRLGNMGKNPGPGFSVLQPGPPVLPTRGEGIWYFYLNPSYTYQLYNATLEGRFGEGNKYRESSRSTAFSDINQFLEPLPSPERISRESLLEQLVSDNGHNSLQRFFLFHSLMPNQNLTTDIGLNYILFNNIFNGAESLEQGLRLYLMRNIADQWDGLSDQARLVAAYSLFKPNGENIPMAIRFLSYEILASQILDTNTRLIFLELLRLNYIANQDKTYVTDLKRSVGNVKLGFVGITSGGFLFSLSYQYSTIDFVSAKGLPQYHQWMGFQLGKVFD
ncbi:lipid A deacylase LpxR family protein [Leptospira idonii]|uniref:Lipid A deacylase LpxR family protein n=1 Tax=Leptospira idonii TaxID=1193500 RepID=A0A4R9LYI8_9LEPT|nr:lipid A deacylase LpxR family protein [Leptospira idonii]